MNILKPNRSAAQRIPGAVLLTGILALASGCVQTQKLGGNADGVSGRPVSVLSNPAMPMAVGTDSDSSFASSGSAGLGLAVSVVDTTLKAATGTYQRSAQVVRPSFDAAKIVEEKLVASLAAQYGTTSTGSLSVPVKPVGGNDGWPDKTRVAAIAAGARSKGFDGLVLDLVPIRYEAMTQGHGLTIGGAKVQFAYIARFALIDAASGELLASGDCFTNPSPNRHKLDTVLEGGQSFVDAQVTQIAGRCADDMRKKALSAT